MELTTLDQRTRKGRAYVSVSASLRLEPHRGDPVFQAVRKGSVVVVGRRDLRRRTWNPQSPGFLNHRNWTIFNEFWGKYTLNTLSMMEACGGPQVKFVRAYPGRV